MKRSYLAAGVTAALMVGAAGTSAAAVGAADPGLESPSVGTVRVWPTRDPDSALFLKEFTLRGVGPHSEVWVASGAEPDGVVGLLYPAGDCRNDLPGVTTVTDAQARSLVEEFEQVILPTTAAFSVGPDRDGSAALSNPLTAGLSFRGPGDKAVVLVDNIPGLAGVVFTDVANLTDRNLMYLDGTSWRYRLGEDPAPSLKSDCTDISSKANDIEATFAHEYAHVLQIAIDPVETEWVGEGLAELVATRAGYIRPELPADDPAANDFLACYHGFADDCGGPQNSLTWWGDEGADLTADYGIAYSFMLYLGDRFGDGVLHALHRDGDLQGVDSLQAILDAEAGGISFASVLHDFQAAGPLDALGPDAELGGVSPGAVATPGQDATLNLDNPRAYVTPGVAPNGADYLKLRRADGSALPGSALNSLAFSGAGGLPAEKLSWTVADGLLGGDSLFSGAGDDLDASAVLAATVPADGGVLAYETAYAIEKDFDFAYTLISTDDGRTYQALTNQNTAQGPLGAALTGKSEGVTRQTFDLGDYAGQDVLIALRYVTDSNTHLDGWFVRDVTLAGEMLTGGTTVANLRTITSIAPEVVAGWSVQVLGLDETGKQAHVVRLTGRRSSLSAAQLAELAAFPAIVVIVGYDDRTGRVRQYAPYDLTVNGAAPVEAPSPAASAASTQEPGRAPEPLRR